MSKNNMQSKIQILIIGGASKIAREVFKLNHELSYWIFKIFKSKRIKRIQVR